MARKRIRGARPCGDTWNVQLQAGMPWAGASGTDRKCLRTQEPVPSPPSTQYP